MISAIITLYNPNNSVIYNIRKIAKQVDRIILCDNSKFGMDSLKRCAANVVYIPMGDNLGLSKAFNRVLQDNSFEWNSEDFIIFFDQDSVIIGNNYIENIINEYMRIEKKGFEIGCLGPVLLNSNTKRISLPRVKKDIDRWAFAVDSMVTSSMLCKYKNLKKIGFWNENLFLDYADWELCWRFIFSNKMCFRTKKIVLKHSIGQGEKKIGVYSRINTSYIRRYYQTKNALYLLGRRQVPIRFKIRFLLVLLFGNKLLFVGEQNKKALFYAIYHAYIDWLKYLFGIGNICDVSY